MKISKIKLKIFLNKKPDVIMSDMAVNTTGIKEYRFNSNR